MLGMHTTVFMQLEIMSSALINQNIDNIHYSTHSAFKYDVNVLPDS